MLCNYESLQNVILEYLNGTCFSILLLQTLTANGDVIVTLLPINTKWPWITPAVFRPELVPEELMAQGLTVWQCIEPNKLVSNPRPTPLTFF